MKERNIMAQNDERTVEERLADIEALARRFLGLARAIKVMVFLSMATVATTLGLLLGIAVQVHNFTTEVAPLVKAGQEIVNVLQPPQNGGGKSKVTGQAPVPAPSGASSVTAVAVPKPTPAQEPATAAECTMEWLKVHKANQVTNYVKEIGEINKYLTQINDAATKFSNQPEGLPAVSQQMVSKWGMHPQTAEFLNGVCSAERNYDRHESVAFTPSWPKIAALGQHAAQVHITSLDAGGRYQEAVAFLDGTYGSDFIPAGGFVVANQEALNYETLFCHETSPTTKYPSKWALNKQHMSHTRKHTTNNLLSYASTNERREWR